MVDSAAQVHSRRRERVKDCFRQGMAVRERAWAEEVRAPLASVDDALEACRQAQ